MSKSIGLYCPHCGTRMRVNGRKKPSPVLHKLVTVCNNDRCLASFNAHVEIVSSIHPSLTPDEKIAGSIRNLQPWFKELDFLIQSVQRNPDVKSESIQFLNGYISALHHCSLIDLTEAQTLTRRIQQINLFSD